MTTNVENKKFHGLKRAVSEIAGCTPNSGEYIEVHYDTEEDKIITHFQVSFGYNSWTEYDDPAIVCVGNYSFKTTMKELKQDIINAVKGVNDDIFEA